MPQGPKPSAEIPATALHLAVDTQFGTHVLDAASAAVDATLRRDPQLDVLIVGFGAEVEAAITQLLFDVGHGQWWLADAIEDQPLAADLHTPLGRMAGGTQDQQFEVRIVTGIARTLDAVQLFEVELTVARAGHDPAANIGEQLALGIGQRRGLLQDAGATRVVDHDSDVARRTAATTACHPTALNWPCMRVWPTWEALSRGPSSNWQAANRGSRATTTRERATRILGSPDKCRHVTEPGRRSQGQRYPEAWHRRFQKHPVGVSEHRCQT
jgi:hypothetical protein